MPFEASTRHRQPLWLATEELPSIGRVFPAWGLRIFWANDIRSTLFESCPPFWAVMRARKMAGQEWADQPL